MDIFTINEEEDARERHHMRTSCRSFQSFDGDDLPHEDDLLCEIVPEKQRVERLKEIQTPFEGEGAEPYASACVLLARLFKVPISLVSLLYEEFQWFKAGVGLDTTYTPRCFSFCTHTLKPRKPEILYVPDAFEDERFCNSPLVQGPPHIRFYCGVPLLTEDGVRLGALCVKDRTPRAMDKSSFQFLINMAEIVVREMTQAGDDKNTDTEKTTEKTIAPAPVQPPTQEGKIRRLPSLNMLRLRREKWFEKGEGVLVVDVTNAEWDVLWTNPRWNDWSKQLGRSSNELWSVMKPLDGVSGPDMQKTILKQVAQSESRTFSFTSQVDFDGLDKKSCGKSTKVMSCTALSSTQPIAQLQRTINSPHETASWTDDPTRPGTISFDGSNVMILFVKPARKEDMQDDEKDLPTLLASEKRVASKESLSGKEGAASEKEDSNVAQLAKPNDKKETSDVTQHAHFPKAADLCSIFESLDEEKTGKIKQEVMVNIIRKISDEDTKAKHVEMIERLIDAHSSVNDGLLVYKEFLEYLFA